MEVNPNELFKAAGRPLAGHDDIIARRRAFQRLRKNLGMDRNELSKVTGLTARTIGNYFSPSSPRQAPTWATIKVMHTEAIARAKAAVSMAEDGLFRAEIELQNLEKNACTAENSGSACL